MMKMTLPLFAQSVIKLVIFFHLYHSCFSLLFDINTLDIVP